MVSITNSFFLNTALKTYKAWLGRGPYKNRPHTGFDPQVQICLFLTLKQTSQEHGWLRESLWQRLWFLTLCLTRQWFKTPMKDYFIKRLIIYSRVKPINIIWRLIVPPEITDLSKFLSPNKPQTEFSDQPLYLSVSQRAVVLLLTNATQEH